MENCENIEKIGYVNSAEQENKKTPAEISGIKLAEIRKKKGYSVKILSRISGIKENTINKMEAGIIDLNHRPCDEVVQLVFALGKGCHMEDLLTIKKFDVNAYEEEQRQKKIENIKLMKREQPDKYAILQKEKAKKKQEINDKTIRIAEKKKLIKQNYEAKLFKLCEEEKKLAEKSQEEFFELFDV